MYSRIFAFDYDGTLAEDGSVPLDLQMALEQMHAAGYPLFLVTGRHSESVELGPLCDLFTGIVWENGAVLYHTATDEDYLPFGEIDSRLVEALVAAGVPLEYGRAIVSTRIPHRETSWRVINEIGSDAVIEYNRGAIMILPAGATKATGLERLLELCGLSPRNLVCFGDAENDLALLNLGEVGVAVGDAVPSLIEVADVVTSKPGPAGVLEALEKYWLGSVLIEPPRARERERLILLGKNDSGILYSIPGANLAGANMGVFGDSGSGKSWVTGLLTEGMRHAGYQVLLINPEGDYRSMRTLPGMVSFHGNQRTLPAPELIVGFLETVTASVVLDLSAYPVERRDQYVAELLRRLRALKERKFRPHWIVLEEAQQYISSANCAITDILLPRLAAGGWAFVSYRPDRLAKPVLESLHHFLLTRLSEPEALLALRNITDVLNVSPDSIPKGYVWLCGDQLVQLRSSARRLPHIRHLHKYLDTPLQEHKRFHFRDKKGILGLEAASLFEFLQILPNLPIASLEYHQARGDFANWAEDALGDGVLATHLRKLTHRQLADEALRQALLQRVSAHNAELHALH
jgi:hydroxymethylpyrimidine pyrophosphatase-like HAD family hydrolase